MRTANYFLLHLLHGMGSKPIQSNPIRSDPRPLFISPSATCQSWNADAVAAFQPPPPPGKTDPWPQRSRLLFAACCCVINKFWSAFNELWTRQREMPRYSYCIYVYIYIFFSRVYLYSQAFNEPFPFFHSQYMLHKLHLHTQCPNMR